jgi:hypothetical protein
MAHLVSPVATAINNSVQNPAGTIRTVTNCLNQTKKIGSEVSVLVEKSRDVYNSDKAIVPLQPLEDISFLSVKPTSTIQPQIKTEKPLSQPQPPKTPQTSSPKIVVSIPNIKAPSISAKIPPKQSLQVTVKPVSQPVVKSSPMPPSKVPPKQAIKATPKPVPKPPKKKVPPTTKLGGTSSFLRIETGNDRIMARYGIR